MYVWCMCRFFSEFLVKGNILFFWYLSKNNLLNKNLEIYWSVLSEIQETQCSVFIKRDMQFPWGRIAFSYWNSSMATSVSIFWHPFTNVLTLTFQPTNKCGKYLEMFTSVFISCQITHIQILTSQDISWTSLIAFEIRTCM